MILAVTLPVMALVISITATLLTLKYRKDVDAQHVELSSTLAQSRAQADLRRQELNSLTQLVKRQLHDGAAQKQRQQALASRLAVIESLEAGQQALATAKTRLADGQSLRPMIQRGAINANEAHLLSLVHRQAKSSAHG